MPVTLIPQKTMAVLKDAAFDIPKARPPGELDGFLKQVFAAFIARIGDVEGPLAAILRTRADKVRGLCEALIESWRSGTKGDAANANSQLDAGMHEVRQELIAMSRRHSSSVLRRQSWYRLAAWGAQSHEHMFHVPFEKPQKPYRFSSPGVPAIYLANSVYLCWLECGQPAIEKCVVSRFEIETGGLDFLDLPCSHQAYLAPLDLPNLPGLQVDPRRVTNSPYVDDVVAELADYLTVWPLLAAVSVRKLEPSSGQPPEYVVPQLLMRWVAQSEGLLGIRYFTTKQDPSTNSQDWSVNLVLPSRTTKDSGYCDFLVSRTRFTPPQPLSLMGEKSLKELVTRQAGDKRQEAIGRYMLRWPDGRLEHYVGTVFGKMEYWLDRPEIEVASIRNA